MYSVIVNDKITYNINGFEPRSFNDSPFLDIMSDDLRQVKADFADIKSITIMCKDAMIASYGVFDSIDSISYLGNQFIESMNTFSPVLRIGLIKSSLAEEVEKLNKQINPIVDFDNMNYLQAREYMNKKMNEECTKRIYNGEIVLLPSSGQNKKFSFTQTDQSNIDNLASLVMSEESIDEVPYHADGEACMAYSRYDILAIYIAKDIKVTQETTKNNLLHMLINRLENKDEILSINYDDELPEDLNTIYMGIMASSIALKEKLTQKYFGEFINEGTDIAE